LGFYVLALLIIEATLAIVLTYSKLTEEHVWNGFICMLTIFVVIAGIVTIITVWDPKKLLYGKEEHADPALDPSALKDQIEDLIAKNVKEECLIPLKK
jgi:heme/copper-type cytochrome/quinol oxidase subunit 2